MRVNIRARVIARVRVTAGVRVRARVDTSLAQELGSALQL